MLLPSLTKNERALERFLNEARVSSNLSHPNIVNVYDVQNDGDLYFLTMELLEGQDLRQVMDNQKDVGGVEGYVDVEFTITKNGSTANLNVIETSPQDVFNRESLRAVSKYKYRPKIVNGKAVDVEGVRVRVNFNLAK